MRAELRRLLAAGLLVTLSLPLGLVGIAEGNAAGERVYIALGDSISAGLITTLPQTRGYPAIVQGLLQRLPSSTAPEVTLVNLAVQGETTQSFLDAGQLVRFQQQVKDLRDRQSNLVALSISLGGNDILGLSALGAAQRQAGLDQFKTSYPAALAAIRSALGDLKPAATVLTYYDLSEGDPNQQGSDAWWLAQFNQVIRATAAAQGFAVADLEPLFRGHIADWTWYPADIHPNNAGHEQIATAVWRALGLDQQAPAVTIASPPAGPLPRRTPTIRVAATDNVGITSVDLWVDDQNLGPLLYLPQEQAYVGIWDARRYQGSQAKLLVRAADRAGHATDAAVDVTLPNASGG